MVKTDVNGYVSGFGLWSDENHSDFIVHADNFAVGKPPKVGTDPTVPVVYPFIIGDVNGETVIALNAKTLIPDAHITNAMIEGTIQSDDYDFWTTGWGIHKDWLGTGSLAVFHNIYARGDIEASTIKTGILEAKHIKGGAITKVYNNEKTGMAIGAGGEVLAFTLWPVVPTGMLGNAICMLHFQGAAGGAATNVGVKVVRVKSTGVRTTLHTNAISVASGFTAGSASSFSDSSIAPGTRYEIYLTDTWSTGSISAGRVGANMMLSLM
jgi:hypothetical protein